MKSKSTTDKLFMKGLQNMCKKKVTIICFIIVIMVISALCLQKAYQMYSHVYDKLDQISQIPYLIDLGDKNDNTVHETYVSETVTEMKKEDEKNQKEASSETDILEFEEREKLLNQEKFEENLLNELESDIYTFENPLVVVNPYGISPLTAIVCFTTEQPVKVSLELMDKGVIEADDIYVDFSDSGFLTKHILPIYGLYPDTLNTIKIVIQEQNGKKSVNEVKIQTEGLNSNLQNTVLISDLELPEKYQKGFNFSFMGWNFEGIKKAFDSSGIIRWFFTENYWQPSIFKSENDHIFLLSGKENGEVMYEMDYLGRIYAVYIDDQMTHHDFVKLQDNRMILTKRFPEKISSEKGLTIDDLLTMVDLSTGKIIKKLDYKEIIPKTRNAGTWYTNKDWCHMNSVVEYDGDVIVSSNVQSAIIRNDWDGNIKWILSDPLGWYPQWRKYLLKPVGENFEYSYNQHAVDVLPDYDNDPDTVDIIVFDNGQSRNVEKGKPLYSRLVHYRINEKEMTVEQIWQFGKEYPELYSAWRGDANLLPNKNFIGTFDQETTNPIEIRNTVYIEVDPDGKIVWECYAADRTAMNRYNDYRCERADIYAHPLYTPLGEEVKIIDIFEPETKNADNEIGAEVIIEEIEPAVKKAGDETVVDNTIEDVEPVQETVSSSEDTWVVTVDQVEEHDTLNSVKAVKQYDGSIMEVNSVNDPSDGNRFVLVELTVKKNAAGRAGFAWDDVYLADAQDNHYSRANDIFLTDHNYERISGSNLQFGENNGWACFETPKGIPLSELCLTYKTGEEIRTIPLQ